MGFLTGAAALVLGVVVVIVGAVFPRKAHPTSGYLFIAAGAVVILFRCCFGTLSPDMLIEAGWDYDAISALMMIKSIFAAGHLLLVGTLFAAAFVTLAKQIPDEPS